MGVNKRRGEPPIPPDLDEVLTEDQQLSMRQLGAFGWELHIVRRARFEDVEVILQHSSGKFASLTAEGELAHEPAPVLRDHIEQHADEPAGHTAEVPEQEEPVVENIEIGLPLGAEDQGQEADADPREVNATVNKEPVPRQGANGPRPGKKVLV